jgi:DNA adenine methylase
MSVATTNVRRPLLRYFGGKWQLRHWIIKHMPSHQFYAEPFAGAASVLLGKTRALGGEIINDLNGDVINLFRVMQDVKLADELQRKLEWTPYANAELVLSREVATDPVERARRMLIRSFMGIEVAGVKAKNSGSSQKSGLRMGNVDLRRLDQDGKRTFRNCANDWFNWKQALPTLRDRLARVMIYERDALEFIRLMDAPDCLLYIDPTYHHSARSDTRYVVEFREHTDLVTVLLGLSSMVLLSGYPNQDYKPLEIAGWKRVQRSYRANMSLDRRTECLWISPNAQ